MSRNCSGRSFFFNIISTFLLAQSRYTLSSFLAVTPEASVLTVYLMSHFCAVYGWFCCLTSPQMLSSVPKYKMAVRLLMEKVRVRWAYSAIGWVFNINESTIEGVLQGYVLFIEMWSEAWRNLPLMSSAATVQSLLSPCLHGLQNYCESQDCTHPPGHLSAVLLFGWPSK